MALRVFVLVSILGMAFMTFGTVQRWHTRRIVLSDWPIVGATVQSCFLSRTFPFRSDGGGVLSSVRCNLQFAVAGRQVTSRVESSSQGAGRLGGSAFQLRHGSFVQVNPDKALIGWLRRHPAGTRLDVRYNPANPAETTFVGADDVVDLDPVPGSLFAVVMFAALGLSAGWGANRLEQRALPPSMLPA